ncbi:MAG TPA: hypothetical protein VGV38_15245 [Pyrinomonadaceae bacterium]|nr:hypothetical protein [Pyrinomonadaceae bacterium]
MRQSHRRTLSKPSRTPPWAGWALLFFLLHAFVVGATHLHARVEPFVPSFGQAVASVGGGEKARDNSETAAHFQCPLCRLQRGFDSDLEGLRPSSCEPTRATLRVETEAGPLFRNDSTQRPSGRAPPA